MAIIDAEENIATLKMTTPERIRNPAVLSLNKRTAIAAAMAPAAVDDTTIEKIVASNPFELMKDAKWGS